MKTMMSIAAALITLALAACGKGEDADPYLDAIPDAAGLTLEIQGGAAEGLALTVEGGAALEPAATAATPPATGDDLANARRAIRALNEAVRHVFARVAEIASSGGRELPGGVKVFGPADRCVEPGDSGACLATANLRLTVRLRRANVASFDLEARPVGSTLEEDFEPVLRGYLVRGAAARRGTGKLAVHFQTLAAIAPGFRGEGHLVAGFASGPFAKAATFRMRDFTRDPAQHAPITAAFSGFRTPSGTTRVRVAAIADLDTSGPDTELGLARIAYNPAIGGRAYSAVASWLDRSTVPPTAHGDVPAGQYWFGRACYAPGQPAAAFKEWFLCPVGVRPVACLVTQGGSWADAVGAMVIGDPGDTWRNTCSLATEPRELAPPADIPAADAGDVTPEDAQDATGLEPPPPPDDLVAPDLTPPAG
jgi:hypothetical protein